MMNFMKSNCTVKMRKQVVFLISSFLILSTHFIDHTAFDQDWVVCAGDDGLSYDVCLSVYAYMWVGGCARACLVRGCVSVTVCCNI